MVCHNIHSGFEAIVNGKVAGPRRPTYLLLFSALFISFFTRRVCKWKIIMNSVPVVICLFRAVGPFSPYYTVFTIIVVTSVEETPTAAKSLGKSHLQ